MAVNQFIGGRSCGITGTSFQRRAINKMGKAFPIYSMVIAPPNCSFGVINRAKNGFNPAIMCCGSVSDQHASDYITINPSGVGESESRKSAATSQSCVQNVQLDLIMLSLPAIAGQAIEPMAQLMETAYIGRLGPLELASAGVSTSIFNILSKVFNIPLLSVATSFVAEDISRSSSKDSTSDSSCPNVSYNGCDESTDRKLLPSVSTALVLALTIGILEALAMYFGSGLFLDIMGISSGTTIFKNHFLDRHHLCAFQHRGFCL